MTAPLPLTGLRVLSAEQYGAGPFGSMHMADLGAEVIKIEQPGSGDSSRASGPYFLGAGDSHFFQSFNRNKRSLTLDLRQPEGREILHRLVADMDVVMNNMRGDQPGRLGITYDALARVNPRIVCAHISGYGRTGERATWPAYDYLLQAEAGFMAVTGEPEGDATRMGLSIVDYMTGVTTAFAVMAAMFGVARTGLGRDVDVTLYDVAMQQLTYPAAWYLNEGFETPRRPRSGHPFVVPCEVFPTADGHVFIMCILPKFWEAFARIAGRPDLPGDPRFATPQARFDNRTALIAILDDLTRARGTADWMAALGGEVPVAPVLTLPQALDNPFFRARGGAQAAPHPTRPDFAMVANPVRLGPDPLPARCAPALGADTDAILDRLGYGAPAIAALRDKGVV